MARPALSSTRDHCVAPASSRSRRERTATRDRSSAGFQISARYRYTNAVSSDDHDRGIAADVLDGIVENDIVVLDPAVRGERQRADAEDPTGEKPVPGEKFQQREGVVQALVPGGKKKY